MRDIKFRAWVKKNDEMFHDVDPTHYRHDDESYALMQYTGLKDINGKEIYEGDIVKYQYHFIGYVAFEYCEFILKSEVDTDFAMSPNAPNSKEAMEVIGNIYENPELLEASQ